MRSALSDVVFKAFFVNASTGVLQNSKHWHYGSH